MNGPTEIVCLDSILKRRESHFPDTCRNLAYVTSSFLPICQQPRFSVSLRRFVRRTDHRYSHSSPASFVSPTSNIWTRGEKVPQRHVIGALLLFIRTLTVTLSYFLSYWVVGHHLTPEFAANGVVPTYWRELCWMVDRLEFAGGWGKAQI